LDLVFTTLNGPPVLLRNNAGASNAGRNNAWVGFQLQGTASNRDAIGARVIVFAGNRRLVRWVTGGSSYVSSHDKRVLVGLGDISAGSNVSAEILWPNGIIQKLPKLEKNRYYRVVETLSPSSNGSR